MIGSNRAISSGGANAAQERVDLALQGHGLTAEVTGCGKYTGGAVTQLNPNRAVELDPPGPTAINSIVGFGEDARGEIYICDLGGEIFKIVPVIAPLDVNLNGIPDTCEWRLGDINHDGQTNVNDLLSVITTWGTCVGCPSDIAPNPGGNGTVDVNDLLMVISNWG